MCGSCCEHCNLTRRAFLSAGAGFALAAAGCSNINQVGKRNKKNKIVETEKEINNMDNLKFITYCGLYCGLCAAQGRIPKQAKALRETMANEGWDKWGVNIPDFKEFWKFLNDRCEGDKNCPGCRQGGGAPFCSIRKCAVAKNIETCALCDEYPCNRVNEIAKGYPTLLADGKRMKEFGLQSDDVALIDPVDFLSFLQLENNSKLVLTDSGGVQEETCILGVPCVTLRDNTERPETLEVGSNVLAGTRPDEIVKMTRLMLGKSKSYHSGNKKYEYR